MRNRNEEEAVTRVEHTGQRIVPGQEGREDGKEAAGLEDAGGRRAGRVLDKVADSQQQESEVEREEE